jgi:type I restriction enzyme S subunit
MSKHPLMDSWIETNLGDILQFNYGKSLPDRVRSGNGFPVYGSNGIVGNHDKSLTHAETLIIGRKGSVGEVHFSSGSCFPIDTTYYVDQFHGMPSRYWFYLLTHLRLSDLNKATAIPGLNREDAYRVMVPLAPLAEQKRIADKLDALLARVDGCRARLARVPAILKRFRQAVLAAATSGALTADWREEDTTSGWDWERAEDVCEKVQSGGTPKEGFVESEGIPFLKVYNIVDQKVNFFYKPQFVTVNVHNGPLAKSRAKPGDVLMNIVGPPLGKVAIVPDDFPEWNINQAITLFRPSSRVITEWLYYFLCSGISIASVEHQTRGSAGQSNISLSQCRNFIFPVPPLEEQHEIIHRVEILFGYADRLEARYTAAAARVERLTPALLAKAFRGELVAQDSADEPAGVLLERVQAARGAMGESRARRRPGID